MFNNVSTADAVAEEAENDHSHTKEVSPGMSNAVPMPCSIIENEAIPTVELGGGDEIIMNEAEEKWVDEGFNDRSELSDSVDLNPYCDYYDDFGMCSLANLEYVS
jgi:hypothetical protein